MLCKKKKIKTTKRLKGTSFFNQTVQNNAIFLGRPLKKDVIRKIFFFNLSCVLFSVSTGVVLPFIWQRNRVNCVCASGFFSCVRIFGKVKQSFPASTFFPKWRSARTHQFNSEGQDQSTVAQQP